MAATGKIDVEVELKSPADKFWAAIRDSPDLFPKAFPNQYKSIDVLEGDGKSVGTIRLVKYAEGSPEITFSKEKIEVVDEGNKTVSYSVIDGDLLKFYKVFKPTLVVSSEGDGSVVKWSCEFEKASEEIPNPDIIKEFAVKNFQELDAYLLKA
ncbi:OLC1v1028198C1 [Oldenlandia corymbosa var. corymbosa]|uniref:OLC1v1028198C1 n=1 Tax=Oldenlandia corymbosa var. corymbosa TaxID=529605 RepID=A0AAV1CBY5_OLDCO|nr:OLC1v1028198C1 [Oldenlandia corymbosa var. corymbosa]